VEINIVQVISWQLVGMQLHRANWFALWLCKHCSKNLWHLSRVKATRPCFNNSFGFAAYLPGRSAAKATSTSTPT